MMFISLSLYNYVFEATNDRPVDVSRLDMRIGRILSVKKHPGADTLYVEESKCNSTQHTLCNYQLSLSVVCSFTVDVGEDSPRTVCSGLVNHISIEQMAVSPIGKRSPHQL